MRQNSTPTRLLRGAAVLLVLFAVGHTLGFLAFKAPTPEGRAVLAGMNDVRFTLGGHDYSYGGFYRGFGLDVSAYLLFTALLAWRIGGCVDESPRLVRSLTSYLLALQLANAGVSVLFFSLAPQMLSALLVTIVAAALWTMSRRSQAAGPVPG